MEQIYSLQRQVASRLQKMVFPLFLGLMAYPIQAQLDLPRGSQMAVSYTHLTLPTIYSV